MIKVAIYQSLFTLFLIIELPPVGHLAVGQVKQFQLPAESLESTSPANEIFGGLRWETLIKDIEESRRIWFVDNRLTPQGDSMVSIIRDLRYYGLLPRNYHLYEIEAMMGESTDLKKILRVDALLTDAFFSIAYDLKNGRSNPYAGTKNDSLLISILDQAVSTKNLRGYLEQQEPTYAKYKALKEALKVLLNTLKEDTKSMGFTDLATDFLPLQKQIQDIEINMERWRWEKQPLNKTYILVNIPSFKLEVFADDTVIFESKVIVGKPRTPTPVLSSLVECFITYPYWHVPRSIASAELLPKIQDDPSYLTRNNFDVLDSKGEVLDVNIIKWENYNKNNFPFVLRQREGTDNALGIIKFVFDNPYNVYVHDTDTRSLFKNEIRAYSHGCVRVEKAEELAHLLITGTPGTPSPIVENYLQQKKRHTMELAKPVPIHIRYFTCEYKDRKLYQYTDIYRKDEKVTNTLYK